MKIAAVVQRYGTDVVGGAERLARGVAEGLAARGHDVEVLTSCARSYTTWANAYPEGVQKVNGVVVRRFRSERERDVEEFNARSEELFRGSPGPDQQTAWVDAQGPFVPPLVDYLHGIGKHRDRLLFFTYLYYPTVHGVHVAPERSVLVPTAHDEAPLHLPLYETVFALPAGLVFNTRAEATLVRRRFIRLPGRTTVIGVGIDGLEELGGESAATDEPTLLYAGRIEEGKGVGWLIDSLRRYRRDSGRSFRLWLMGETAMELPHEDWIVPLGFVSEQEKRERLRDATVLMMPSKLESFGIVALEAMAAGTPVLADAGSEATVEHCRNANAGLYYRGYPDFRAALDLLLTDPRLRQTLAHQGATYVRANYSWPTIVDKYEQFLKDLT